MFTTPQALSRHRRTHHEPPAAPVAAVAAAAISGPVVQDGAAAAAAETLSTADLIEKIRALEVKVMNLRPGPTFIQNNVTLNVFGSEVLTHITREHILQLLDKALMQHQSSDVLFTNAAMLIYSDREHPENITAYLPSSQGDQVMVYQKGLTGEVPSWQLIPLDQATPPMVKQTIDLVVDRQPWEGHEKYGDIMRELIGKERFYMSDSGSKKQLRAILVRNREYVLGAATK